MENSSSDGFALLWSIHTTALRNIQFETQQQDSTLPSDWPHRLRKSIQLDFHPLSLICTYILLRNRFFIFLIRNEHNFISSYTTCKPSDKNRPQDDFEYNPHSLVNSTENHREMCTARCFQNLTSSGFSIAEFGLYLSWTLTDSLPFIIHCDVQKFLLTHKS